jgi:hypothetical protein
MIHKTKIPEAIIPFLKTYTKRLFFSSLVFTKAPYLIKLWCKPKPPRGIMKIIILYAKRTIPSSLLEIKYKATKEAKKDKTRAIMVAIKM